MIIFFINFKIYYFVLNKFYFKDFSKREKEENFNFPKTR